MDWEEYLKNELAYYDEHPEEDAPIIEAHTNDCAMIEISYMDWTSSQSGTTHVDKSNPFAIINLLRHP